MKASDLIDLVAVVIATAITAFLDRGLLVTAGRIGDVHHRPAAWQCLHPHMERNDDI